MFDSKLSSMSKLTIYS